MRSRKKIIFVLVCCLLSICVSARLSRVLLAHADGVATSSEASQGSEMSTDVSTGDGIDISSEVTTGADTEISPEVSTGGDGKISPDASTQTTPEVSIVTDFIPNDTASDETTSTEGSGAIGDTTVATQGMQTDSSTGTSSVIWRKDQSISSSQQSSGETSASQTVIPSDTSSEVIIQHDDDATTITIVSGEISSDTTTDGTIIGDATVATPSEAIEGTDHKILLAQADVQSTYTLSVPATTQIDFTANDTLLEVTISGTSDTQIEVTATSTNSWQLTSISGATIGYGLYTNTTDTTATTAWTLEPLSADTKISVHAIADVVDLFFADSGDYTDSIRFVASSVQ